MLRLCLFALLAVCISASSLLPYPAISYHSIKAVYAVNYDGRSGADQLLIQTLSGALARLAITASDTQTNNLLYKLTGNGTNVNADSQYIYWSYYQTKYKTIHFDDRLSKADIKTILTTVYRAANKQLITEFVLADIAQQGESDSVNIALSLAGTRDGVIVVTSEHLDLMQSLNIQQWQDVTQYNKQSELAFVTSYQPFNESGEPWPFNRRYIGCQTSGKATQFLSDWIMLTGSYQLHHTPTVTKVLPALYSENLFALLGWTADAQSENEMTAWVTQNGGVVWAADTVSNMGTHAAFNAPTENGENMQNPTRMDANKRVNNRGKHTVAFLWSDGDALAADVNGAVTTDHWLNPHRGTVPQTWSLNPSLAHIAPSQLQYFYDTSVANDSIIAFTPGYAYPDMYPSAAARQNWAEIGAEAMARADMGVNLMIGFNFTADAFEPIMAQWNVEGMVYFCYPNYYVLPDVNGSVIWIHDKPVIAIRDSLWADHSTPESIADMLNKQSRDHTSVGGYSVIGVHMWSQTVDTVNKVAALLDEDVVVVKLDELVRLMTDNVQNKDQDEPQNLTVSPVVATE